MQVMSHFLALDQFRGFSGSSGPSQSTMVTSELTAGLSVEVLVMEHLYIQTLTGILVPTVIGEHS